MATENTQKVKLLKLWEILKMETDEYKMLTASEICERLNNEGIKCDRRTLTKDMNALNDFGFEVFSTFVGHEKAYYVIDHSFEMAEVKILIDAVQAANFITEKKTEELVDKLSTLVGSYRGDVLKSNIVIFNTRKHCNESIYYNVSFIEDAIEQNRKITFKYFDLDEKCNKIYRKDGEQYITDPIALIYHEDNYYLVGYSVKHEGETTYRVDRMDNVEVLDEEVCKEAKRLREKLSDSTTQKFKMFSGDVRTVKLKFPCQLIDNVFDKFGKDIKIRRINENECTASVKVQISPTFWGWLFQFGTQMQIMSPESIKKELKKRLAEVYDCYKATGQIN